MLYSTSFGITIIISIFIYKERHNKKQDDGMKENSRAQASPEYFAILIVGLVVAIGAVAVVYQMFSATSSIHNNYCEFDMGISCTGVLVSSNSTMTVFAMVGSNSREYPIKNIGFNATLWGNQVSAVCAPGEVNPGQPFVCLSILNSLNPSASYASGNLIANVSYCGMNGGNCTSSIPESYVGSYTTDATKFKSNLFQLMLGTPTFNPPGYPEGTYLLNASLGFLTYNFTLSNLQLLSGGNTILNNFVGPSLQESVLDACGAKLVTASFYTLSAERMVGTPPPISNVSTINIAGNNHNVNLTIVNGGTVAESGNKNDVCFVVNTTRSVALSVSGNQNKATFLNGTMTVTVSGNLNNVYLTNIAATHITVSGNQNIVYLHNVTATLVTMSGNQNYVYLYDGSTVASNTISGNNNYIMAGS
jgi:hypothetical protein